MTEIPDGHASSSDQEKPVGTSTAGGRGGLTGLQKVGVFLATSGAVIALVRHQTPFVLIVPLVLIVSCRIDSWFCAQMQRNRTPQYDDAMRRMFDLMGNGQVPRERVDRLLARESLATGSDWWAVMAGMGTVIIAIVS